MKAALKYIFRQCMRLFTLPLYLLYRLEAAAIGERKAFTMACQGASLVPGITGEYFRQAFLAWATGCSLDDCCIGFGTTFSDPRVRIEEGVYLGRGCDIGFTHIGKNCLIGSGVHILSGLKQHLHDDLTAPIQEQADFMSKSSSERILGSATAPSSGRMLGRNASLLQGPWL